MSVDLRFRAGPLPSLDALEREWTGFDAAGGTTFFTSWLWIGTWLKLLPKAVEPLLLRVTERERSVALAILVRRATRRRAVIASSQLHFNATGDEDYDCLGLEHNGFATNGIDHRRLWPAFLAWLRSGALDDDEIAIAGVTDAGDGIEASDLGALLDRAQSIPCFEVDLSVASPGEADTLPRISRNARQQLTRAMRNCAELGALAVDPARDRATALAYFDAMKPLHIAHWTGRGKQHSFSAPFFETFHRTLIAECVEGGRVDLLRVRAGDTVLGYLYNFRHRGRTYAYQSGFAGMDRRRIGYVCHALAIRHCGMRGDLVYDFMAGANRLKRTFASREYSMTWHVLQKPLLKFRAEAALRAAKNWVLGS